MFHTHCRDLSKNISVQRLLCFASDNAMVLAFHYSILHHGLTKLTMVTLTQWLLQLVIYGIDGSFVGQESLQNSTGAAGAIHNITNYLITYLVPGGPRVPINAVITFVRDNATEAVATAFDAALAAGYSEQLIALLKQVSGSF